MKATAKAPANIAFIKYWGKKDEKLRIPYNPSISMNLSACITMTTVEFSPEFIKDSVSEGFDNERIIAHVDKLRVMAGSRDHVRITTANNFPKGSGIASSASGFAALTVAAAGALGLHLLEKELSSLARLGSGSACRSIPDGFVKWDGEFAYSLYPSEYWDIRDILVIVAREEKKISSSEGHSKVETSPFFTKRLAALPERIERFERALKRKDFISFGEVVEEDCLDMHAVMQTQNPPLFYWNDTTKQIVDAVRSWRNEGVPVYFTIDAGPNVHVLCEGKDEKRLLEKLEGLEGIEDVIPNKPAVGARVTTDHLF